MREMCVSSLVLLLFYLIGRVSVREREIENRAQCLSRHFSRQLKETCTNRPKSEAKAKFVLSIKKKLSANDNGPQWQHFFIGF